MYSADPQRYGDTRCKHWRGRCIADVTRHSLKDAGEGSDQWNKIKALSSKKLTSQDRWRRYFIIFNDETETYQMNHPYWVNGDAEDQVTDFLRSTMDQMKSDLDPTLSLKKIEQYSAMLAEKKLRDASIRLQCQEEKTAAMRREFKALEDSQLTFKAQFEEFLTASNPTAPIMDHLDLAGAGLGMSIQRSGSGRGPEADMSHLEAHLVDASADRSASMLPTGPAGFSGMAMPAATFPGNHYFTSQQPVNEVIATTEMVMDGTGHLSTANHWQTPQFYDQQSRTLRPPLSQMQFSDSGIGSSMPSAHRPISSANSAEDNSNNFGIDSRMTPSGDTSPFGQCTGGHTFRPMNGHDIQQLWFRGQFMRQ
ncbi:hypothetical protein CLAIMM_11898 [Cladophialophora immunda]|nr:hypothetical protein CLAIMM_11898 [Cladophialophora immunda]